VPLKDDFRWSFVTVSKQQQLNNVVELKRFHEYVIELKRWKKLILSLFTLILFYPIVVIDRYISSLLRETGMRRIIKENKEIF
jgi:hypothetical protein